MTVAPDPQRFSAPSGADLFAWSQQPNAQGLPLAQQPWTVQVDWLQRPAAWSLLALGTAPAAAPVPVPGLGLTVLIDPVVTCTMALDAGSGHSSASFLLPPAIVGVR